MDDFFVAGRLPKLSDRFPDIAKKYPEEAVELDEEEAAKPANVETSDQVASKGDKNNGTN